MLKTKILIKLDEIIRVTALLNPVFLLLSVTVSF